MKTIYFSFLVFITCIFGACNEYDYEKTLPLGKFEGNPGKVTNLTTKSLPGQILLKWDIPSDSSYYYVQIKYFDPLVNEEKAKVVSIYSDTALIENTRAKFGDYKFFFQAFNSKNVGGEIIETIAKSGAAPISESFKSTRITLIASQLSSNAQEPKEGPIKNLVDNDPNTFFHTKWSADGLPWPHWIDVKLNDPIENFTFNLQNRATKDQQSSPADADLFISNDGVTWEKIVSHMSGFPTPAGAEYTSDVIRAGKTFTYFRFSVNAAVRNTSTQSSFNLAEFGMSKIDISTFDPETE